MRAAKQAVPRHARFGATYVLRAPDGQTGPRVNPAAARLSELPPPPKGSKKPHVSHSASPRFVLPELSCESGRCMSSFMLSGATAAEAARSCRHDEFVSHHVCSAGGGRGRDRGTAATAAAGHHGGLCGAVPGRLLRCAPGQRPQGSHGFCVFIVCFESRNENGRTEQFLSASHEVLLGNVRKVRN